MNAIVAYSSKDMVWLSPACSLIALGAITVFDIFLTSSEFSVMSFLTQMHTHTHTHTNQN